MRCSICQLEIDSHTTEKSKWSSGHNAEPVNSGRCCSSCNYSIVVPARVRLYMDKQRGGSNE